MVRNREIPDVLSMETEVCVKSQTLLPMQKPRQMATAPVKNAGKKLIVPKKIRHSCVIHPDSHPMSSSSHAAADCGVSQKAVNNVRRVRQI